jgi:hypothetical protein
MTRSAMPTDDPRTPAGNATSGTGLPGRVYLVTSADQPGLGADDRLLHDALLASGVPATVAVWTDATVDWTDAAACVIRSVWDYHLEPERFTRWLGRVGSVTTVLNPPRLVAWNMHKRYLRQLAAAGIPTVDTTWITPGTDADVRELIRDRGWEQALLKPAVSASAWRSAKVGYADVGGQHLLREILRHSDAMLQPYLSSVERDGEVSVVAIDGQISHAARRQSALTGDIEHTRQGSPHEIGPDERLLAERVLDLLPVRPLYARVDLLRDGHGDLLLGELELIEPVLYLRHGPQAIDRLVAAIRRHIHNEPPAPSASGAKMPMGAQP